MSFNWQQALGPQLGSKIENILDKKNSHKMKERADIIVEKVGSFQEFFPLKTIVNGIAVHNDGVTFTTYIKVGRVNFANKDNEVKELLLKKYDEVLNIIENGQFHFKKGKLNSDLLLYSMENNKHNLVGFEKTFHDIQKEHYQKEIIKRNISTTDRLIVIQCKLTKGRYQDKLQEAIRILTEEQLAFLKKIQGLKVNYVHICNTYDVLELLIGELAGTLEGNVIEKLRFPQSGVFVTKVNEIDEEFDLKKIEVLDTKGNDLIAVGEWSFKDLLINAPIHFAEDHVRLGQKYIGIKCLTVYPDVITDETFNEILNQSKYSLTLSIHIKQQDKSQIISEAQGRLNKLSREIIGNVSDKASKTIEKNNLEQNLIKLNNNTNNFLVKIYYGVIASHYDEMIDGIAYIDKLFKSKHIKTYLPALEMKDAFMSLLPLGVDYFDTKIEGVLTRIGENFLTQALSCINIFQGTDLVHKSKRALRYGYDRDTNNFIVADRVQELTNPAGLLLGTPGQGKSGAAKHEIGEEILVLPPGDQIFTVDYIGEYSPFCQKFGYPEMFFDVESGNFINPLDLNPYAKNPLNEKADKFTEWLAVSLDRKFDNHEITAIDNAFYETYREKGITEKNQHEVFKIKEPRVNENTIFGMNQDKLTAIENEPILEDFQRNVALQGDKGKNIAEELDIFVKGTHRYLNERTTLKLDAKYTNFNLTTVRDRVKPAIFYLIKEKLEEKGKYNFKTKNKRIIYLYYDEMHRYFRNPRMGANIALDYKEGRKEGLAVTGITQNVQDLLRYEDGVLCLINADFILLLGTDKASRDIISKHIDISKEESEAFNKEACNPGDGLLIFGGDRIPIHISCSDWELKEFDTRAYD